MTKNRLAIVIKLRFCLLLSIGVVLFFAQVGRCQDIKKQLKAAIKSDKSLAWEATKLYQDVLDNPEFKDLNLAEKLNVYDRLTWLYYVEEKYDQAEPLSYESVRLRETSNQDKSIKKDDIYYTSSASTWYTQALEWNGKALLAVGKFKKAQMAFQKAFEAYRKFNDDPWQKWELLVGLGRSYYLDGQSVAAIPLYQEAFGLKGPDGTYLINDTHFVSAKARCELANMYRDRGDFIKADALYLRAINIMDSGVYQGRKIKAYDDIRIENFLAYEQSLRLQNRNTEADNFHAAAESIKQSYRK